MSSDGSDARRRPAILLFPDGALVSFPQAGLWLAAGSPDEALAASCRHIAGASPRSKVHVCLSAALCPPVRIERLPDALSRAERVRAAEATATAMSGLQAPCKVWLHQAGDADIGPAVVVEQRVLAMIEATFATARIRVASIRPWWAWVLQAALRERPALKALAIWEGSTLTLLSGSEGRFTTAQTLVRVASEDLAVAALARSLVAAAVRIEDALAVKVVARAGERGAGERVASLGDMPFAAWAEPMRARP